VLNQVNNGHEGSDHAGLETLDEVLEARDNELGIAEEAPVRSELLCARVPPLKGDHELDFLDALLGWICPCLLHELDFLDGSSSSGFDEILGRVTQKIGRAYNSRSSSSGFVRLSWFLSYNDRERRRREGKREFERNLTGERVKIYRGEPNMRLERERKKETECFI